MIRPFLQYLDISELPLNSLHVAPRNYKISIVCAKNEWFFYIIVKKNINFRKKRNRGNFSQIVEIFPKSLEISRKCRMVSKFSKSTKFDFCCFESSKLPTYNTRKVHCTQGLRTLKLKQFDLGYNIKSLHNLFGFKYL